MEDVYVDWQIPVRYCWHSHARCPLQIVSLPFVDYNVFHCVFLYYEPRYESRFSYNEYFIYKLPLHFFLFQCNIYSRKCRLQICKIKEIR